MTEVSHARTAGCIDRTVVQVPRPGTGGWAYPWQRSHRAGTQPSAAGSSAHAGMLYRRLSGAEGHQPGRRRSAPGNGQGRRGFPPACQQDDFRSYRPNHDQRGRSDQPGNREGTRRAACVRRASPAGRSTDSVQPHHL